MNREHAMSHLMPALPDPLPLREGLRGLRHVVMRGAQSLAETVDPGVLPRPAAAVAAGVMQGAVSVSRRMDTVAARAFDRALGGRAPRSCALADLRAPADGAAFARCVHAAMGSVLVQLGPTVAFVSEAAAKEAHARALGAHDGDSADRAAALHRELLAARILRDATSGDPRLRDRDVAPVATFAVLLWLQSRWPEEEGDAALAAAVRLAMSLAPRILLAAGGDHALAPLFRRYADHV